ncbi:MAG: hypothetical protein P0119_10010 [Nitrospira sp.]|nr:hypothetical protein [Nitrospira sp.]
MTEMIYHGGPVLEQIELVCIYLNVIVRGVSTGNWSTPQLREMASSLDTFLDPLATSAYLDALAEYGEDTVYQIGQGRRLASYFLTAGPFLQKEGQANVIATSPEAEVLDKANMQGSAHVVPWLRQQILRGVLPFAGPNRCYVIFLPPGLVLELGIGLHDAFFLSSSDEENEVYFAVIVYPEGKHLLDQFTLTLSHEIAEVVTNPSHARSGWHTDDESSSEMRTCVHKCSTTASLMVTGSSRFGPGNPRSVFDGANRLPLHKACRRSAGRRKRRVRGETVQP